MKHSPINAVLSTSAYIITWSPIPSFRISFMLKSDKEKKKVWRGASNKLYFWRRREFIGPFRSSPLMVEAIPTISTSPPQLPLTSSSTRTSMEICVHMLQSLCRSIMGRPLSLTLSIVLQALAATTRLSRRGCFCLRINKSPSNPSRKKQVSTWKTSAQWD